jgi:hypothetical protein
MTASFPLPDQPLPEGWIYIQHPEIGRSQNPVLRASLSGWEQLGWTEVAGDEGQQGPPQNPQGQPVEQSQQQQQQQVPRGVPAAQPTSPQQPVQPAKE